MTDKDITICGHGSGNPTKKNLNTYATQRYDQKAPNGKRKGIVAVRRVKGGLRDPKQFSTTYKSILGRNIYNQDKRQYVYTKAPDGKYYSDCSSSGIATLEKLGYKFEWLYNTAAIYTSGKFSDVPVKISNGHITNPELLQPGDAILFAGSDPSRPKQIGHVEWVYAIPGQNCKVTSAGVLYSKPDQTKKTKTKFYLGDVLRVIKDCKNGWSEVMYGDISGYAKNPRFTKVGKSGYPKRKTTHDAYLRTKNSSTSEKIMKVKSDIEVKIITKRPKWSYISFHPEGYVAPVRGWFPTKYINY